MLMSWDWSMPTVISPATSLDRFQETFNARPVGPTTPWGQSHRCHFAVALTLSGLLAAGSRLGSLGVVTRDFSGKITTEPSVIGWMPSAQIYFPTLTDILLNTSRSLMKRPSASLSVRFQPGRRDKK